MTGVQLSVETGIFSPHHYAQTCSRAHASSYSVSGALSPGVKLTIHVHLVPRLGMRGAVLPLLHTSLRRGT